MCFILDFTTYVLLVVLGRASEVQFYKILSPVFGMICFDLRRLMCGGRKKYKAWAAGNVAGNIALY
jgi:hypothetical protein